MATKKEQNQRKTIKELLKAIQHRNMKILSLLDENRLLRDLNFEQYCAITLLAKNNIGIKPYEGFKDPYIKAILEQEGIDTKGRRQDK